MKPLKEIEKLGKAKIDDDIDGAVRASTVVIGHNLLVAKLNELIDAYNQLIKQDEKLSK